MFLYAWLPKTLKPQIGYKHLFFHYCSGHKHLHMAASYNNSADRCISPQESLSVHVKLGVLCTAGGYDLMFEKHNWSESQTKCDICRAPCAAQRGWLFDSVVLLRWVGSTNGVMDMDVKNQVLFKGEDKDRASVLCLLAKTVRYDMIYFIVQFREICLGLNSCAINALTATMTTNNTSSAIPSLTNT